MNWFEEKYGAWAVVTGASQGIGAEFCERLALAGINLVLVARDSGALDTLAKKLSTHNIQCRAVALDLSQPEAIALLAKQTQGLDIGLLVASAGFGSIGTLIDSDLDNECGMVAVNCSAVLAQCHFFGKRFATQRRGGIILLSSIVAFQGVPGSANYAATKAYVQSLAEGLALELQPFGVDVLAVAPGPVNTGFAKRAGMNMGKALSAKDIAQASLYALGKRTTTRPGWLSKLLGYSLAMLPRWGRTRVLQQVMRGMAKAKS